MTPSSWTKDPGQIEAEVIMNRQANQGSFLVLEGPDDHKFWRPRVALNACELVIGDGKPNVEGALVRLDKRGFLGALGIVDDDYDRLEGRTLPSPNLLATDAHDLESVLLRSSALDRVLAEFGDPAKIRRFEDPQDITVRAALLQRGLPFGRLRWLSLRLGWGLSFDHLRPERFADSKTWVVDQERLYAAVTATGVVESTETLKAATQMLPQTDPWSICQGHDLISLLRIGLQRVLGDLKPNRGVGDIAALLRAAYDERELHQGALGGSIDGWQSANPPYRVLFSAGVATVRIVVLGYGSVATTHRGMSNRQSRRHRRRWTYIVRALRTPRITNSSVPDGR